MPPNNRYGKIIKLILEAFSLAGEIGIKNLLQPGLVKEIIIADALGHEVLSSKREADACLPGNPGVLFEYLSCVEGGKGQLDRMFSRPPDKRKKSLERITRNEKIFLAIFYKENQIKLKIIYEIAPGVLLAEAKKQLDKSRNEISHIGVPEKWAAENGKIVYQSK